MSYAEVKLMSIWVQAREEDMPGPGCIDTFDKHSWKDQDDREEMLLIDQAEKFIRDQAAEIWPCTTVVWLKLVFVRSKGPGHERRKVTLKDIKLLRNLDVLKVIVNHEDYSPVASREAAEMMYEWLFMKDQPIKGDRALKWQKKIYEGASKKVPALVKERANERARLNK